MVRFFAPAQELQGETLTLTGDAARHGAVLRLKAGELVEVCDGEGTVCTCRVVSSGSNTLSLSVEDRHPSDTEAKVSVTVYMAYSKSDKLEHVIQKATELGAAQIVAFPSARCVARPDERGLEKKLERWQKIAASAAEQSGRGVIPKVTTLKTYADALREASLSDLGILFYEHEEALTLRNALEGKNLHSVSILTGPEGGLEEREVEQARQAGLQVCTLGKRVLRCETAPLCALAAIMYHTGEF